MAYFNRNILFLLIAGLLIVQAHTSSYKDLNIDFLLEETVLKKKVSNNKKNKKSFSGIIEGFKKIEGLFNLYWNQETNQAYISILNL